MTTSGPNPPQAVAVVVLAIEGAMASEDVEMDVYRLLPQNPLVCLRVSPREMSNCPSECLLLHQIILIV